MGSVPGSTSAYSKPRRPSAYGDAPPLAGNALDWPYPLTRRASLMSTLPTPDFVAESLGPAPQPDLGMLETRRHQMFPVLTCAEMTRLERFGTRRVWNDGEAVVEAGRYSPGMVVVVDGKLKISRA